MSGTLPTLGDITLERLRQPLNRVAAAISGKLVERY